MVSVLFTYIYLYFVLYLFQSLDINLSLSLSLFFFLYIYIFLIGWNGGLVLVSHDFRLINQVAREIWLCEDKTVKIWKESIQEYKSLLKKEMMAESAARSKSK